MIFVVGKPDNRTYILDKIRGNLRTNILLHIHVLNVFIPVLPTFHMWQRRESNFVHKYFTPILFKLYSISDFKSDNCINIIYS